MPLSVDEILQLAPDPASAKAAKGLVIPSKWPTLGASEAALWGECKGSGSKPYQVQIDPAEPAFRCTCPSRKFPCKHGLALMLLWTEHAKAFTQGVELPAWVAEWLASRQKRAEKQEQKAKAAAETPEAPADPQAAAKREAARQQRMNAGIDELERWLADHVRHGLAALPAQPTVWGEIAARMVDAQLPGLAFRLRQLEWVAGRGHDWPARLLARFGQLQLLIDAFRRISELPDLVQADVRTALGLATDKTVVVAQGERIADTWLVLGQSVDEEDRLWVRRAWLHGQQSGRRALLLDYSHGGRRFDLSIVTGTALAMTLAFYPGAAPLRAIITDTPQLAPNARITPVSTLDAALADLAAAISANPWQWPQSLLISDGVPVPSKAGWRLRAGAGQQLPLHLPDEAAWPLVAESGGSPITVFGEWNGETLRPLSASFGEELVWREKVDAT
jgi:hypothetical protein